MYLYRIEKDRKLKHKKNKIPRLKKIEVYKHRNVFSTTITDAEKQSFQIYFYRKINMEKAPICKTKNNRKKFLTFFL